MPRRLASLGRGAFEEDLLRGLPPSWFLVLLARAPPFPTCLADRRPADPGQWESGNREVVALGGGREMVASAPGGWEAPSRGFWEQRGMVASPNLVRRRGNHRLGEKGWQRAREQC